MVHWRWQNGILPDITANNVRRSKYLAARGDRAEGDGEEDNGVHADVDDPGPEKAAGLEHGFAHQPARDEGHNAAEDAVGHAVVMRYAEIDGGQQQRLGGSDGGFQGCQPGSTVEHFFDKRR